MNFICLLLLKKNLSEFLVKQRVKIPVVFPNLKNYDSHLIMQQPSKYALKVNVIANGLERFMSFTINIKLSFIDSFQFLSSSLDSLVENLSTCIFL